MAKIKKAVKSTRKSTSKSKKVARVSKSEAAPAEEPVKGEPTQGQLELAKAKELIEPMARADSSDEEMVVKLITEGGFQFKKAGRLLQLALEDMGVRLSNKDRYEQASELLVKNDFAPDDWAEVIQVCEYLASELDATSEKQALVAVKKFAKENEITLPEKPKGGGGGNRSTGLRAKVHAWMVSNATASDADLKAWLEAEGESRQGHIRHYQVDFSIARKMAAAIVAAG